MQQDTPLFNLSIDAGTRTHLLETARWARFLAIIGMVMLVVAFLFMLLVAGVMGSSGAAMDDSFGGTLPMAGFGIVMVVYYLVIMAIWFFPLLYLLRFANHMRTALHGNDQQVLDLAFRNLKACFRFVGIVTIIMLSFMVLGLVFGVLAIFFLGSS